MSKNSESEISIYAKIGEPEGLKQANHVEHQEQWEYRLPVPKGERGPKMRVRKTTIDGRSECVETIKIPLDTAKSLDKMAQVTEYPSVINEEYYQAWIKAFGTKGCKKTRYTFITTDVELTVGDQVVQVPRLKYEVDVFLVNKDEASTWCKIDIEVDELLAYMAEHHPDIKNVALVVKISHLPFKPTQAILGNDPDPEKDAIRRQLWDQWNLDKESDVWS